MYRRAARWRRALSRAAFAAALLVSISAHAQAVRIGGTGSAIGTMRLLGDALARQDKSFQYALVANLGSSGGLRALQAGAIDVALISRPLKAGEAAAGLVAYEYGRSPFVIITSKPGVRSLPPADVADFLSGRRQYWPDGAPVRVVMRPSGDGDNAYIAGLSPVIADALQTAHQRPGMVVATTDQEAADEAERLPGSLAFNTLALLSTEHRKLQVVALDGVAPTLKALAEGRYPHAKSLLIVTRGVPVGAVARFIEFVRSPAGRALLEANGHLVPR